MNSFSLQTYLESGLQKLFYDYHYHYPCFIIIIIIFIIAFLNLQNHHSEVAPFNSTILYMHHKHCTSCNYESAMLTKNTVHALKKQLHLMHTALNSLIYYNKICLQLLPVQPAATEGVQPSCRLDVLLIPCSVSSSVCMA